jgi:hypothetical protein
MSSIARLSILGILAIGVAAAFISTAHAFQVLAPELGGSGTSTTPAYGKMLIGGLHGEYEFVASSTLGISGAVSSVFGRAGAVTAQSGDYTTSLIPEGSNLYWTQARFDAALTGTTSLPKITTLSSLSLPYAQLTAIPNLFSTTSTDYWKTANNFYSTTSADYWLTQRQGAAFSTTSADFWQSVRNFFSTTSASYFLSQNQGTAFSTTSADWWGSTKNYITGISWGSITGTLTNQADLTAKFATKLGTSSPLTPNQLIYATAFNTTASTPTTTASCSGSVSCTSFTILGSSPITINGLGGGGGGGSQWISIWGGLYNATTSDQVMVGESATSTGAKLEVNGALNVKGAASSTSFTNSGTTWLTNLSLGPLAVDSTGKIYKAATTTFSAPLIYSNGAATIQAASASQNGYQSSFDWQLLHTATTTFSSPLVYTVGTNAVTCPTCNTSNATVSSVAGGTGLNGGTITTAGTLSLVSYLATSTADIAGQLLYWNTTNGTPAKISSVATSTLTPSSPLTGSLIQIGSGGSLGCQSASGSQAGCLTSGDWTTFNSKENALTFSSPLIRTVNAISWSGLATTSQPASSNLLVSNGGAGVYGAATTSVSCSGTVSCTGFTILGSAPITITGSGGGAWPFTPAQYASVNVQATTTPLWLQATSPFSLIASSTFATYASTTALTNTGTTWLTGLTSALLSTDSTGKVVSTTSIGTNLLTANTISGITLGGTLAALTATDGTLTFSGSYTGATARTVGLNLGNANSWTGLQTISAASTTNLTASNFWIIGQSSGCAQFDSNAKLTSTGTACGSGGSGAWPFTTTNTNFGVSVQSTTTPEWFKAPTSGIVSLMASSTAWLQYASTTAISATTICLTGDTCRTTWPTGGSGAPGGSNTQLQYNNGGSFAGASFLTFVNSNFGIGTSTPALPFSIGSTTNPFTEELNLATTTNMSIGIASSSVQHIDYSTSAVTLTVSAYQVFPGESTRIFTCGPNSGTAGAITWAAASGIHLAYPGGPTQPGNTTQASTCDEWFLDVDKGPLGSTTPWVWISQSPGAQ